MHRRQILGLLDSYREKYPGEIETVDRFVSFVEENEDCFKRELKIGHLTGSAWLVDSSGENVLLTHHRKLDIWVQLGGHADGESDLASVAYNEALEESGLNDLNLELKEIFDLDVHLIPERKGDPAHYHYDVRFVIRHSGGGKYIVSEESHDLAWVDVNKIGDYTKEESMLRMQRKWLESLNRSSC